jgi:hypothetical protein
MVIASLMQAFILIPLFLVHSQNLIWIIYICAFADSLVTRFFEPAQTAIIPVLVEEKDLLPANSLNSMSHELTRLVGPSLGGLLFGLLGIGSVITLDLISFLLSAVLVASIVLPARIPTAKQDQRLADRFQQYCHKWPPHGLVRVDCRYASGEKGTTRQRHFCDRWDCDDW